VTNSSLLAGAELTSQTQCALPTHSRNWDYSVPKVKRWRGFGLTACRHHFKLPTGGFRRIRQQMAETVAKGPKCSLEGMIFDCDLAGEL
jgi:hypothetical protein